MKEKIIIDKMLRYLTKVVEYCQGYNYDQFVKDEKTTEACVFNLSQLGELCRTLDDDFMKIHSEIPCAPCTDYAIVLCMITKALI